MATRRERCQRDHRDAKRVVDAPPSDTPSPDTLVDNHGGSRSQTPVACGIIQRVAPTPRGECYGENRQGGRTIAEESSSETHRLLHERKERFRLQRSDGHTLTRPFLRSAGRPIVVEDAAFGC